MICKEFIFSAHAIKRMFDRDISIEEVKKAVEIGEIIKEYPNDKPYPSFLLLGKVPDKIIHVVMSKDNKNNCLIITVYVPDNNIWADDFKSKK